MLAPLLRSHSHLLCFITLFAAVFAGQPVLAGEDTKLFVGPVLQTNPRDGSFIMRGGGSKRYARVQIRCDAKTQWSGIEIKQKTVKQGDPVRVTCVPAKEGGFRAITLHKIDPHEKPIMGRPSPKP
jgi:hypothetical protein